MLLTPGTTIANKWSSFREITCSNNLLGSVHSYFMFKKWNSYSRERACVQKKDLHIYIYIYLLFLQDNGFLKRVYTVFIRNLPFVGKIVLLAALVQRRLPWCIGYCISGVELCISKKGGCKLKTGLHMVRKHCFFTGILYHLEEDYFYWKGMLHPLEDSSIFCSGIAYWKTIVLSQRKTANRWTMLLCKQGTVHCSM